MDLSMTGFTIVTSKNLYIYTTVVNISLHMICHTSNYCGTGLLDSSLPLTLGKHGNAWDNVVEFVEITQIWDNGRALSHSMSVIIFSLDEILENNELCHIVSHTN